MAAIPPRHHHHHHGPGRSPRHSRAQRAGIRAEGDRRRAAEGDRARRWRRSHHGITTTTTGPGAALGIPERNALEFVPKEIGGVPLKVIVLDDGGDPTTATPNARRFVTESKADIIMGSSTTPP